jgi:hypothetical protein
MCLARLHFNELFVVSDAGAHGIMLHALMMA